MKIKVRCNESESEAITKYFGKNWNYHWNGTLIRWNSLDNTYRDIILQDGIKERIYIQYSNVPNMSKIFKNLIKRISLEKNKTSASFKRQVKRIV